MFIYQKQQATISHSVGPHSAALHTDHTDNVRSGTQRCSHVFTPRRHRTRSSSVVGWLVKCDTHQQHQMELDPPPRPAPLTNVHGQLHGRGYLTPIEPRLLLL